MTYSIVARDPGTGHLGVAVQSHYFSAGGVVPWAEAGVGAVATQSVVEVSYGPRGLDAMRRGVPAERALADLVAADPMSVVRQVAMVDSEGGIGVHTGEGCVGRAGHRVSGSVSAQANMMERDTVWHSMIEAFERTSGRDLADRLLAALDAAEAEGGDIRGRQSAGIVVVAGSRSDAPWNDRVVDLRVDDSSRPLTELRRLLEVRRAVAQLTSVFDGGLLFAAEIDDESADLTEALDHLQRAQDGLGENHEPTFWSAVLLAKAGRTDDANRRLDAASSTNPRWRAFVPRLVEAGVLPADHGLRID